MMIKILLFFLILLPIAYAEEVEIKSYNPSYMAGETFQADIIFNQVPLNNFDSTKITVFNEANEEVIIAPFLYKIRDNRYFLYFDLPQDEIGNLKLVISDLLYKEEVLKEKDFETVFNVAEDDLILTIKPAFFFESASFSLEVISKKGDVALEIKTDEGVKHVYTNNQSILEGRTRDFNFKIEEKLEKDLMIKLNYDGRSYIVPIFAKNLIKVEENTTKPIPFVILNDFNDISRTLKIEESIDGPLEIKNLIDEEIEVSFALDGRLNEVVKINNSLIKIDSSKTAMQYFWINNEGKAEIGKYGGNLTISAGDYQVKVRMEFEFVEKIEENYAEEITKELFEQKKEPPVQEGIDFFKENETYVYEEEKKGGIGSLMIMILVIFLAFIIYIFTRKKQKHEKFDDYLKEIQRK